jgi:hypothetical protein
VQHALGGVGSSSKGAGVVYYAFLGMNWRCCTVLENTNEKVLLHCFSVCEFLACFSNNHFKWGVCVTVLG